MKHIDIRAAMVAGAVAGTAYIAAMEADLRLTGHNADDLKLLGRPFARDRALAKPVGAVVHLTNAMALGVLYALVAHDRLPGPPWLRGATFANIENAALYPVAMFEDHHPGIRDGQIDRYWTPVAFLQSIPRHIAYGAVLGILYQRLRRDA